MNRVGSSSYAKPTSRNSTSVRRRASGCAPGRSITSVCVSSRSKIRSAGRDRLLDAGVHAAQLLHRAVHQERGREKRGELARREPAPADFGRAPHHSAPTAASPPMSSMSGGSAETAPVIFMFVRNSECVARANRSVSPPLGAERLDDAMPGERLRAEVRDVLELLLAAPWWTVGRAGRAARAGRSTSGAAVRQTSASRQSR